MNEQGVSEGGTGAPTAGEGGLSVPIGVHIEALFRERDKLVVERLNGVSKDIKHLEEVMTANRRADTNAVQVALVSQKELAEKHNDLINAAEKKDATYALGTDLNRIERWQSRLTGGLVVIGAIGLTNFVKVWTG